MKKSNINIEVTLDENHVPEELHWSAKDGGIEKQETKALMLTVWDEEKKEALRIDLWTKEMPMDDMKIFFHQMFATMANTYARATSEDDVAHKIRLFAEEFAVEAGLRE
ncbi:gliding motility protein GldC [Flavobacteriaceae bacterium Ap0902]|nr:gliding motility protein GldC [Flavobacteriaceae bacterium Ap0902]